MIYRDIEDVGHKDTKIYEANVGRDDPDRLVYVAYIVGMVWCSGRDLNPGLRLERPEYLSRLYYRSIILIVGFACF